MKHRNKQTSSVSSLRLPFQAVYSICLGDGKCHQFICSTLSSNSTSEILPYFAISDVCKIGRDCVESVLDTMSIVQTNYQDAFGFLETF